MKNLAPVVLTVFNRPLHAKKVLESLSENDLAQKTVVYVFSDGPKVKEDEGKIKEVRRVLKEVKGFKEINIIESPVNKGLAKSIIDGISQVLEKYEKVIVLEDDLLLQPYFLRVMNQMLDFYKADRRVGAVTAFMQTERLVKVPRNFRRDTFFNVRPCSTGWGTWKDRWEKVDWSISDVNEFLNSEEKRKEFNKGGKDLSNMLEAYMWGKVDSWAIRWSYHFYKNHLVSVQTTKSYVDNIGYDNSGTNSKDESYFFRQKQLAQKARLELTKFNEDLDWSIIKRYRKAYSFGWGYIKRKIYSKTGVLIKF